RALDVRVSAAERRSAAPPSGVARSGPDERGTGVVPEFDGRSPGVQAARPRTNDATGTKRAFTSRASTGRRRGTAREARRRSGWARRRPVVYEHDQSREPGGLPTADRDRERSYSRVPALRTRLVALRAARTAPRFRSPPARAQPRSRVLVP